MILLALLFMLFGSAEAMAQSGTLSVSVSSGNVPVPAQAQAVNLTTLAFNSDFTAQMPNLWLGGCPTPGNGQPLSPSQFFDDGGPHIWWMNIWWSPDQNCNPVQTQDPQYGGLVLDIPWTTDNNFGTVGAVIQSQSWDYNPTKGTGQSPNSLPHSMYMEEVSRVTPNVRGVYMVLHTWGTLGPSGGDADSEWDAMETDADQLFFYDSALHNWGAGNTGGFIQQPWTNLAPGTNYNSLTYNTYGVRLIYDGASTQYGCTYINNVLQRCKANPLTASEVTERDFLITYTACDQWNFSNGQCPNNGSRQDMYIKSVRAWSCSSYKTTECPTTFTGPNVLGATWSSTAATQASALAPDGTTPAIRVTEDTSNAFHFISQTVSLAPEMYTLSANITTGSSGSRNVTLNVSDGSGFVGAEFNPSTGAVVTTFDSGLASSSAYVSSGSTPIASGGFKVWLTFSDFLPVTTAYGALLANGTTRSYQGDGTSNVLVWGQQLKLGTIQ